MAYSEQNYRRSSLRSIARIVLMLFLLAVGSAEACHEAWKRVRLPDTKTGMTP